MNRLLEIRTYRLKPGTLEAFHKAVHERAVPMLRSKGMDVVTYGRSDHEEEAYHLVRAYESREALEAGQARSTDLRNGATARAAIWWTASTRISTRCCGCRRRR
ncbi:antibiotic biosynthesis monooxygenase [Variovorax sp. 770b2]|uniref:antibiotic biosynthesis monooxygenase n=1 Tax=Variovorax sp. 770b2 TaxID=1566271 RepID=UPI000B83F322|nr:antibiotic biosynthesis monooxygenase [Variovorax sp. 770b2]